MAQPFELTVAQIQTEIAVGQLSPVELVQSLLARAAAVDPKVQAWERLDPEGALAAAHNAQAQLRHFPARPLEGVPVGIKDIFYTAGLRTAAGFAPFDGLVPDYDAAAVARLRDAGATILGKTVTTQFAFSDPPKTRNPWNQDRTPGGSSSGSGAAVAARLVPAALGSQTAGSVLRPAAYCGVVGFKPSFGRISRFGVLPLSWSLDHVGIIVRTVVDAALVYQAIAGPDARDPACLGLPVPNVTEAGHSPDAAPRLGLVLDFMERAEPEVRDHLDRHRAVSGHGRNV
ncbi:MAG: amidase, partial [Chloroflexota bacterium]